MTLDEFRELTAHLDGKHELLCAGADVGLCWHNDDYVSIDDEANYDLVDDDSVVLFRDPSFV